MRNALRFPTNLATYLTARLDATESSSTTRSLVFTIGLPHVSPTRKARIRTARDSLRLSRVRDHTPPLAMRTRWVACPGGHYACHWRRELVFSGRHRPSKRSSRRLSNTEFAGRRQRFHQHMKIDKSRIRLPTVHGSLHACVVHRLGTM